MNCILIYGLFIIVILVLYFYDLKKENFFNPYNQEERPEKYPDQTKEGYLVEISKYIYTILNSNELSKEQKIHLEDLLNLIQFI